MNLVLFEPGELAAPLPPADPRTQHILKVLRRAPGETFVAGLINGPMGTATLVSLGEDGLRIAFAPTHEPPPLPDITLLVGLPRPQTARDLLRDATTLGVAGIHFVATERADPNYASSTLWTSGEWRRQVLAGAAQACDTRLPTISWTQPLAAALNELGLRSSAPRAFASFPTFASPPSGASAPPALLALDNYEASSPLAAALSGQIIHHKSSIINPLVLALGPERGWGASDRAALRAAGFTLCSLGPRVLRLETAVVAALAIVHAHQTAATG